MLRYVVLGVLWAFLLLGAVNSLAEVAGWLKTPWLFTAALELAPCYSQV